MRWLLFSVCSVMIVLACGQLDPDPPEVTTSEPSLGTTSELMTDSTTVEPITTPEATVTFEPIMTPGPELVRDVAITIAQGVVIGFVAPDGDYYQFHGIPYADSTSGTHRFKAPRPPPSFQDAFIASRTDIKCVRALGVGYEGTEDCLVANIYTPSIDSSSQLPVMVWVKGTEFDKSYEHELTFRNFMEEGVVVVSLNYRESILGFLCLGTETAPGNAGLKDIVAGLEWVQENIEQFGGNPNDITLFGHGSGAAAVDLVTLSPMANGLVHKAIAQSGNAMAPWAVSRNNLEYAIQVAEALGHVVNDIQELSEVFSRASVAALMGVINELDLTKNTLAFAPCIERDDLEDIQPFITRTPASILASGDFLQIPFITGFVDNEGTIRSEEALEDDWLERMDESFMDFLQSDLSFDSNDERLEIGEQIRQFYFGDDRIDFSTVDDYIAYHGETMVLVSSVREVRMRAQVSSAPTYLYQFSYKGIIGEPFVGPLEVETAAHSEELAYMFTTSTESAIDMDLLIGAILINRWTNFAKTGIPTSEISNVNWQEFTTDNNFYLRVLAADEIADIENASLEVPLINPHPETLTFWDRIYERHFLDAESSWSLNERNDDEEEPVGDSDGEESGEQDDEVGGDGDEEGGEVDDNLDDNNDEDGGEEAPEDSSASTAVGYTFLIVTLFSILSVFHSSQLVS